MTTKKLSGKNILITGASRGLGAVIASTMWREGANLILIARNTKMLEYIVSQLAPGQNQTAYFYSCDISQPAAAEDIIEFTGKQFENIDVLVNNAAIQGPIGPFCNNDQDLWEQCIRVNLIFPIKLSRYCAKWMIPKKQGKIISLSGGGATGSRPNFTSYAVAKTGLVRFSEILADELREYNIQVNCVAPGAMSTSLLDEVAAAGPGLAGLKEFDVAVNTKLKGGASPERAAQLVTFLASALSDGITGKLISSVWDPWEKFPEHLEELKNSDIYTLRRIVPKDRGMDWGDV